MLTLRDKRIQIHVLEVPQCSLHSPGNETFKICASVFKNKKVPFFLKRQKEVQMFYMLKIFITGDLICFIKQVKSCSQSLFMLSLPEIRFPHTSKTHLETESK